MGDDEWNLSFDNEEEAEAYRLLLSRPFSASSNGRISPQEWREIQAMGDISTEMSAKAVEFDRTVDQHAADVKRKNRGK